MATFRDSYQVIGSPQDDSEQNVVSVIANEIENVESCFWISGTVWITPDAAATAITVSLEREAPTERVVAAYTVTIALAGLGATPIVLPIEGMDGPGIADSAEYYVVVTVADATGESLVSAVAMHVRYNEPAQPHIAS